jgi:hypothetical protein
MTLAVFGTGYVLGSRAGRERYQQFLELARTATDRLEEYGARQQSSARGSYDGEPVRSNRRPSSSSAPG